MGFSNALGIVIDNNFNPAVFNDGQQCSSYFELAKGRVSRGNERFGIDMS